MSARVEIYRETLTYSTKVLSNGPLEGLNIEMTEPGKWRWRFVKNGNIMADSGQGYSRRIDCLTGAAIVLGGVADMGGCHILRLYDEPGGFIESVRIEVRDLTRGTS